MVKSVCTVLLAALGLFLVARVCADEAVGLTGKRYSGQLQFGEGQWHFQFDRGMRLSLSELSYVRFDPQPTPLPKVVPMRVLVLPGRQRITGWLESVDPAKVTFVAAWGRRIVLKREQVVGIDQAGDCAPFLHDDFEGDFKAWRIDGNASRDEARALMGKSSMRIDAATKSATRDWQPALHDGGVRLFFCDPRQPAGARCTITLLMDDGSRPGVAIDPAGHAGVGVKQSFSATSAAGWHLLSMEIEGQRLRLFVDDSCIGQTALAKGAAIKGIRFESAHNGAVWIDELIVARRLPPAAPPRNDPKQDSLWLAHGEQLFGQLLDADAQIATLDAKFGKRSIPWSQLRGIRFAAADTDSGTVEPEITFRPAPGFSVDCLRAKLLRWDGKTLTVQHGLLGEIAIERGRLDKIRFPVK